MRENRLFAEKTLNLLPSRPTAKATQIRLREAAKEAGRPLGKTNVNDS